MFKKVIFKKIIIKTIFKKKELLQAK